MFKIKAVSVLFCHTTYIHIFIYKQYNFGYAQHFSNKFDVRNKFQKVQKWNCHDLCLLLSSDKDTEEIWPLSAWNVYVWLPHLLTSVGLIQEVRAISSVISAVRCRWYMFLSCPLKLQRGGPDHRIPRELPSARVLHRAIPLHTRRPAPGRNRSLGAWPVTRKIYHGFSAAVQYDLRRL